MTTQVTWFRSLLAQRLGWTFADSDVPHLMNELDRRSAECGLDTAAYLARLGAGGWPAEIAAIAESLTITETYFFRHGEQFRALAEVVLPDRLAARRAERTLRLLSVGCSSGEEAYTMAIEARRAVPDPGWSVSVLGLDANPAMLRKAAGGHYSAWSLRETPDEIRQAWFHPHEGRYEVDAEIRRLVRWKQHNVADEDAILWQAEQYDVIFCRNLLMYLTADTAGTLVARMTHALAPGGYLFLGHTDSLGSRPAGLESRHSHSAFYYRRLATPSAPAPRAPDPAVSAPPTPMPPAPDTYRRLLALVHEERFAEALAEIETTEPVEQADPIGKAGPIDKARPARSRETVLHGVLLAQAGRPAEAERMVRRLLDADGLDADAHHLLGVCLEERAAVDVAIRHYRQAAHLDPGFAMPRLRLGLLARSRGEHRAAAADLDRALHLLRDERDDRIVLFGGGFGRIALTTLCRAELDACGVPR